MGRHGRATEPRRSWHQWRESDAREALAAHARSGLSAEQFCRQHGYSAQRLRYWTKRLSPAKVVSFVPVTLPVIAKPRVTTDAAAVEILCGDVVVRVRETLDAEHIARLAVAIELERARRC